MKNGKAFLVACISKRQGNYIKCAHAFWGDRMEILIWPGKMHFVYLIHMHAIHGVTNRFTVYVIMV